MGKLILTKQQKQKVDRIIGSLRRLEKASTNLEIQRFRRQQAEKGNFFGAIFGKPKRIKIKKTGKGGKK